MSGTIRPPRLPRTLLLHLLPAATRFAVVDELDDEFRQFVRSARGRFGANIWYWRQTLLSILPATAMRARVFRGVSADVRGGLRVLVARPGFSLAAITVLALGIGSTSAILSAVEGILLRPLPYRAPDELVTVLDKGRNPIAPATFLDWQREGRWFDRIAAAEYWTATLAGVDEPERLTGLRLTADMLPMLGVPPLLGRTWTADDARDASPPIVLSYGLWQRRFAGDPDVLGRTILLNGTASRVIGVMPVSFMFAPYWATESALWLPLDLGPRAADRGGSLRVFARRRADVSLEQARADMAGLTARLDALVPGSNRDMRIIDLTEQVVGNVRTPLLILLGAVACVLVIVCANVAHMLLAHAMSRDREFAVRSALGASGFRLAQQLLTENLVLASLGGAFGLGLASLGVRAVAALADSSLPRVGGVDVDSRVLVATIALTGLTGIVVGLVPAWRAASPAVSGALKDAARGSIEGRGPRRTRHWLVASQFALALMLLVGAALLIRSFLTLQAREPGFDPKNVLTAILPVTGTASSPEGRREAFYRAVIDDVRRLPGVESAGAVNHLPLGGDSWGWPFRVEGRPDPAPGDTPAASYKVAWPGYFRTMGIPLIAGRDVTDTDRIDTPPVAVVNRYLAEHYWPGDRAVGKRIALSRDAAGAPVWSTVVGVVGNTIHGSWTSPPEEEVYLAVLQHHDLLGSPRPPFSYITLAIRATCDGRQNASCDAASLVPAVRAIVHRLDPGVPVAEVQTMSQVVANETARERFYLVLLGTFAGVALILAAVGVYSVMSYTMARRVREMGLRMALGAPPAALRRRVVREGLGMAGLGVVAGLAGALALSRTMSALLFDISGTDLTAFVAGAAVLSIAALVACYLPARRATRIDPLTALRSD